MLRVATAILFATTLVSPNFVGAQTTAPAGTSAAALDPGDPIPLKPDVRHGELDNGLHYYVLANDRPEDRAFLWLAVNAGSVLEDEDQLGLAHFVEHMAFNGTEHFEENELVAFFESIGMQFGPDLNASTSFDQTIYKVKVPTDTAGMLEKGLLVLEDWAHGQVFDPEQIEKERGVVIEEWRVGRGARARMLEEQLPVWLHGSRYAERLPIGTLESLESFDPDAARRFYETWYRPGLMAVVAVGDFDAERIEVMIRERFGEIPAPEDPVERPLYPVPGHERTLYAIATDPEARGSIVQVSYKHPVEEGGTIADYRREVIERLYHQMFNRRLRELTQRANPPIILGASGEGRIVRTVNMYNLYAVVRPGGVATALETLLTEAERVKRYGFTASGLERAKSEMLDDLENAYNDRETAESLQFVRALTNHYLNESPAPSIELEYRLAQRFLPTIRLAEVNALGRKWITESNRVVLISAPEQENVSVPTEGALRDIFAAVQSKRIEPYADEVSDAPLVAEVPAPAAIVETRTHEDVGVTEWRLANGVRVLLKPTDFEADDVAFRAYSPGGRSLAPDSIYIAAATAANVVSAGGIGEFDRVALQKKLAGQTASANPWIRELREGLSGNASPENLETLFQIIYLRFTAPRRDSTAFASLASRIRQSLENRGASPRSAFVDTLNVIMAQHHDRRRPPTSELYAEMDLAESYAFYRERFADAGDFTFVFVGAFTVDSIRPLVRRYLGALPSTPREESWRDVGIDPPTGVIERVVRDGIAPKSITAIRFTGPFEYTRENAYVLQALADALRIPLRQSLREDAGGTYGVGVGASPQRIPDGEYTFSIGFQAAPDRLEGLTELIFEEIERMKREGPSAELVETVREIHRRDRETNLKENGWWLGVISSYDQMGRDLSEIMTYDRMIEGLTADALRDAARKYLRTDNYVRVSLYPEEEGQTS